MSTVALPLPRPGRPVRIAGLGLLAGLLLVVLLTAILAGPTSCPIGAAGAGTLTAGRGEQAIPPTVAAVYEQVAAKSGVPAAVLAAVGYIESRHGQNPATSSAGAQGPMQFLPTTWAALKCTGNIQELQPAVVCAARYLTVLAQEPGARRSGVDRWQYAACRYNGGCAHGIRAEAGYGPAGEVAGRLALAYGYTPGSAVPTVAGVSASTSCGTGTVSGGSLDVAAAVAPFLGKSWGQARSAGLDGLGWPGGTAWCMIFVQNVLDRLGVVRPDPRGAHSSAPYLWARAGWGTLLHGPGRPAPANLPLVPGDLVMYGPPVAGSLHINVVEQVDTHGVIVVGGNQGCAFGNGVCERGPMRLTQTGGTLRWTAFDRRPIWAIVRPPTPTTTAA